MDFNKQAKEILAQLTLDEKAMLTVGLDVWHTNGVARLNLPSIMMTDGPHGLRKQPDCGDHLGLGYSNPAVCFPTASKLACSWDETLLNRVGDALAKQCLAEDVSVLLGPGINIKRNSLCGRNFEYFSEDPYLTAKLASNYVNGVQQNGIGVSLKHFCANNQEYARMVCDSVVDERALNEIYLSAFATVIKNCNPYTVMCSYNKVNGVYASQNKKLLTSLLREQWGYDGLVVSDWGAVSSRPQSIASGLDLQMPVDDYNAVFTALENNTLTLADLDKAALNVIKLVLKCSQPKNKQPLDANAQHALAIEVSANSTVLAKNSDNILPLAKPDNVAVIGAFAEKPHYQGGGSSLVNCTAVTTLLDALNNAGIKYNYSAGYNLTTTDVDSKLVADAVEVAKNADKVILLVGLPDICEIEGFDRENLDMPNCMTALIDAVTTANANTIAVMQCGAPVNMQWDSQVKAVVIDYMSGQGGGEALRQVLYGEVNPSGKLAESWPKSADKQSSHNNFANDYQHCLYSESIFVGYRYYDYAPNNVHYPFGHGLGYSPFSYTSATLSSDTVNVGEKVDVTVTVQNNGAFDGKEVVQLYVTSCDNKQFKAVKELKGFAKVNVKQGESTTATITLDTNDFTYYNLASKKLVVDGGNYLIHVASDANNLHFTLPLTLVGTNSSLDFTKAYPNYYNVGYNFEPSLEQFEQLSKKALPNKTFTRKRPFTIDSTVNEIRSTPLGKLLYGITMSTFEKSVSSPEELAMITKSVPHTPVRILSWQSNFSRTVVDGVVLALNGKTFKGLTKAIKAYNYNKKKQEKKQ